MTSIQERSLALVNHSQLEDSKLSWEESWVKRNNWKRGNPEGSKFPLGHTYSIILESLAQEGIAIKPDSSAFLNFIKNNSLRSVPKNITLAEPSYDYCYGPAIYDFMVLKGLSSQKSSDLMKEILGYEKHFYTSRPNSF